MPTEELGNQYTPYYRRPVGNKTLVFSKIWITTLVDNPKVQVNLTHATNITLDGINYSGNETIQLMLSSSIYFESYSEVHHILITSDAQVAVYQFTTYIDIASDASSQTIHEKRECYIIEQIRPLSNWRKHYIILPAENILRNFHITGKLLINCNILCIYFIMNYFDFEQLQIGRVTLNSSNMMER